MAKVLSQLALAIVDAWLEGSQLEPGWQTTLCLYHDERYRDNCGGTADDVVHVMGVEFDRATGKLHLMQGADSKTLLLLLTATAVGKRDDSCSDNVIVLLSVSRGK